MSESNLRSMLNAYANEYHKAIGRGRGKSWLAAFRSYLDLIECEIEEADNKIPPRLRGPLYELQECIVREPFLGLKQ